MNTETKLTPQNVRTFVSETIAKSAGFIGVLDEEHYLELKNAILESGDCNPILNGTKVGSSDLYKVRVEPQIPQMGKGSKVAAFNAKYMFTRFSEYYTKLFLSYKGKPSKRIDGINGRILTVMFHGDDPVPCEVPLVRVLIGFYVSNPNLAAAINTYRNSTTIDDEGDVRINYEPLRAFFHDSELCPGLTGKAIRAFNQKVKPGVAIDKFIKYFSALMRAIDYMNELDEHYVQVEKEAAAAQESEEVEIQNSGEELIDDGVVVSDEATVDTQEPVKLTEGEIELPKDTTTVTTISEDIEIK